MPDPIYITDAEYRRRVSRIVLTQREALGLKQGELAEVSGVNTGYISRIERARPNYAYRPDRFAALAEALRLPLALLEPDRAEPVGPVPAPAPEPLRLPLAADPAPDRIAIPVSAATPTAEIALPGGSRIILTIEIVPAEGQEAAS